MHRFALAGLLLIVVLLASCQETRHIYNADNGATITLTESGRSEQARGGQTTEAVNPEVTAGDVGLPAGL